jgi:hypothetical protein
MNILSKTAFGNSKALAPPGLKMRGRLKTSICLRISVMWLCLLMAPPPFAGSLYLNLSTS